MTPTVAVWTPCCRLRFRLPAEEKSYYRTCRNCGRFWTYTMERSQSNWVIQVIPDIQAFLEEHARLVTRRSKGEARLARMVRELLAGETVSAIAKKEELSRSWASQLLNSSQARVLITEMLTSQRVKR